MLNTNPVPVWNRKRREVPSLDSLVIDVLPMIKFTSLRYSVSVYNVAQNRSYTADLVIKKTSSDVKGVLTNKINETGLKIKIDGQVNASNYELLLTNDEGFDLVVRYARLTLKQ